jgi:molybdenum cofactor cytidylyltransferase
MIAAVILAAGESRRMGRPKMDLPWEGTTVIGQVVKTLAAAGVAEILAVTGGDRQRVEAALASHPVRVVHNPHYQNGEMLSTFQAGLSALPEPVQACLVVLGDQPQMQQGVVESVIAAYLHSRARLVVPSYRNRRGHPWLIDRSLWPSVLALHTPATLRDYLRSQAAHIHYVTVETDSIWQDLDTPQDYASYQGSDPK